MKTLIVYYSLEGNTKMVAEMIADKIDADLLELKPVKNYPTGRVSKYLWGGKSAVMGDTPELEKYDIELSLYDMIIFGTPVWASTLTPPLRTFIRQNTLTDKTVAAFACTASESAGKTFDELEALLKKPLVKKERFTDPLKGREKKLEEKIATFL